MGMPAPPWWCPICLKIKYDEIKIGDVGPPSNIGPASFGLMALLHDYQSKWGMGDYRIDSADADSALAAMVSGDTCTCDPNFCTLNRRTHNDEA
jgi:hypothetical protein